MYSIHLSSAHVERIMGAITHGGGFQAMLGKLQTRVRDGVLVIEDESLADDVIRYVDEYGSGGWQDILRPIVRQIEQDRESRKSS